MELKIKKENNDKAEPGDIIRFNGSNDCVALVLRDGEVAMLKYGLNGGFEDNDMMLRGVQGYRDSLKNREYKILIKVNDWKIVRI